MAKNTYSLLRRRLSTPLRSHSFSTISDPETPLPSRMRFALDRIDAIERERSCKDLTLQRIRASRESIVPKHEPPGPGPGPGPQFEISAPTDSTPPREGKLTSVVELVHPWIEWLELLERLVQKNYFDYGGKEGPGRMLSGLDSGDGFDFIRDFKAVHTAFINFGRDRFDILSSLSRKDIQHLVGYGCPSDERKVVFSSKLLRKHARLDEGDVCSSCSLKGSCVRAYLVTNKEDKAQTFDVMRILLTLGFDPVNGYPANGLFVNKPLLELKPLKTAVRKVLRKVVKLSAVPIDPYLPPPVLKKRPPKVKIPHTPKKRPARHDLNLKKGDWLCTECEFLNFARNTTCLECNGKRPERQLLRGEWECPKCDFLNFAQNTICLECDAKRPSRQLLPGEWECPDCNFLNYSRNMVCYKCECKRPPDEYTETFKLHGQHIHKIMSKRHPSIPESSNIWKSDFDDGYSDGVEVADFEYGDPQKFDGPAEGRNLRYPEDDFSKASCRFERPQGRDLSYIVHKKSNIGFDDFDDEENDVDRALN